MIHATFFLLNRFDDKVFVGEIVKISEETEIEIEIESIYKTYKIKINNEDYIIQLNDTLHEYKIDVLDMIYSKNQIKKYGCSAKTLYETYNSKKFKYSRPIIVNYDFLLNEMEKYDFREKILEKDSLFNFDNDNKVYAKYLEEDGSACFSLTTEKMISEDIRLTDFVSENYRPYFYEFYIENENTSSQQALQIGEIYQVKLSSDFDQTIENNSEVFKGNIFFSASPPLYLPATLEITKRLNSTEKKDIERAETWLRSAREVVNDKSFIQDRVMEYFPQNGHVDFETTIYNIGQGNWSKITAADSAGNYLDIVYDIGMGSSKNLSFTKLIAKNAASEIRDKHIFILSHWDLDHIKGIINLTIEQFNTTWIVPDLPSNLSFPAIRLALYLYKHQNINVVFVSNELNNKEIFSNEYLALGKGEGKEIGTYAVRNGQRYKTSYTVNNNIGLVLCIKNNDEKILFTGDCEYIQIPIEFLNENYYSIVMAHHGARINYNNLIEIGMLPASNDRAKAYVCVGKNNNYPNSEHKDAIESLGFTVVETRSYTVINNQIKIQLPTTVGV